MSLNDVSAKSMMLITEHTGDDCGSWARWSQRGNTKRVMHS